MRSTFPIVGIGASAGGLDAFEHFFRACREDTGMAFVLVPHLDPNHASMLTEILQRCTSMPVVEAEDRLAVEPDHVYVIPPNREMYIMHGVLQVAMAERARGLRTPINSFFRSLAADQADRAIGIVLSGTGSDGSLGLMAILEAGGVTLVQDPTTAKYDGMPSSAIEAGYATKILTAEKMPAALLAGVRSFVETEVLPPEPKSDSSLRKILAHLRSATGHDFSLYKKSTIGRRIERRMAQHNLDDADVYARFLVENPAEVHVLFRELLINVTRFFRDAEAFAALKADILPGLCEDKPDDYVFRVWVAGCASGEEAYSIAILLREMLDERPLPFSVQIYATDLDDEAIAFARAGIYPHLIEQDLSPERLRRFFIKEEDGYRVKKEIREMVVFAIQNVIKDPPFTRLDLLCCRNLMIYLEVELQDRLIPVFHYALKPGGVLCLSPSESIGNHTDLFAPINRKWKFYRATPTYKSSRAVIAHGLSWSPDSVVKAPDGLMKNSPDFNFAEQTRRVLLQYFAPASVVTDLQGETLYVHGDTGKYLRPAPGQASLNVIEMAREGLGPDLRLAIRAAAQEGTATLDRQIPMESNGAFVMVSLGVRPLPGLDPRQNLLLISFQDVASPPPAKSGRKRALKPAELSRIEELEHTLAHLKESHQATVEELQASNEEMKSSNEELQSTNEELQSTNEELETSKEELQSVNEELITVNAELQSKIEQLASAQNDMKNLLDNVKVGIIFLDQQMVIRSFTRDATRVYRLASSDVGRPLSDIRSAVDGDDLLVAAKVVLESLIPYECELHINHDTWLLARIQPYRTLDNVIDGVVLTFTDITSRIKAVAMQEALMLAEGIINAIREPMLVLDSVLNVVSASDSFYREFRLAPENTVGHRLYDIADHLWDQPDLRERLQKTLRNRAGFEGCELALDFPGVGHRSLLLNARHFIGTVSNQALLLLSMQIQP
ncbi:chemotaxis protein CheB [Uliginosibacterium flavum]|uniref:protein-glutamate O-methyltransferase n=1 Tax=Uliginosibacterium flavum TaxID=1396831 RepID=A0ABV2TIT5_9RHOO